MRDDINAILENQPAQHSLDWYRVRLGKFTGSEVGRLMKRGRGKDAEWSADALSYINEIVAERMLNPAVVEVDELFEEYLMQHIATSKAMAWGTDQELNARNMYAKTHNVKITSCGSIANNAYFASSPDGLVLEHNGCIEIKSPKNTTHTSYLANIHTAEDLKAVKPEYYWQCIAHMVATLCDWCDWMSYCPFSQRPLHVVRIDFNADEAIAMMQRVEAAEKMAQDIINSIKQAVIVS